MQDPGILELEYGLEHLNEYDLGELIPVAISGDVEAIKRLIFCDWFTKLIEKIASGPANQFNLDAAKLRDLTIDTLTEKITSIENKKILPWHVCLAGWCKIACYHHALNILRHRNKFELPIPSQTDGEEEKPMEIPSAEDAFVTEKSVEMNEFCQIVNAVILSFPVEDVLILCMWAEGLRLRVISRLTGAPISTVSKHLKKVQKAIVDAIVKTQEGGKAVAVQELLKGESELVGGFQDLVLKSLKDVSFRLGEVRVVDSLKN